MVPRLLVSLRSRWVFDVVRPSVSRLVRIEEHTDVLEALDRTVAPAIAALDARDSGLRELRLRRSHHRVLALYRSNAEPRIASSEQLYACHALAAAAALALLVGELFPREPALSDRIERFAAHVGLSQAERLVLELLVSGHDAQDCAKRLLCSESTVRNHLQSMRRRCRATSSLQIVCDALTFECGDEPPSP